MLKRIQLVLVALFLCVYTRISGQEDFSLQSILIDSLLTENANAIVRSEDIVIQINSINSVTIKTKRVVTVLNKYGNRHADSYEPYDPQTNIKRVRATVFDVLGKEVKEFRKKDFSDRSMYDGFSLIGDNRFIYFEYTPVDYPYTMVYESEVETKNSAFIEPWFPITNYNLSVENASYKVINLKKIPLRTKEKAFVGYPIEILKGDHEISYILSKVPALNKEHQSPPFSELVPSGKITLGNFSLVNIEGVADDWKTMGKWQYQNLVSGRDELPDEVIKKMSELVEGADSKKEKTKRIYEYVQNKTRYISVQLGIGGWMPMKASDVDRLGYGDCKALTNYTKALLESQNIPSFYTIVYGDSRRRDIDDDFASMQGNHVILNVPNEEEDIWLECTSQTAPFNFIGDFTDDRNVLVIKPEGGEIKRTKKYKPEENTLHTTATIFLQEDASMVAEVVSESKGLQYDWRYLTKLKPVKDQKLYFKEYWSYINNLNVLSLDLIDDKDHVTYQEKVKVNATNYATKVGTRLLITPNVFNRVIRKKPKYKDRKTALVISRGYVDSDEYIIKLPAGYIINKLPEGKVFETDFGVYSCSVSKVDQSTLKYIRELRINDGRYPKEQYEAYRQFMSKIQKADKTKIVLKQQ
ncbi:Transglutaminase-like enzyme, putative cysteine protease [Aquimarina amphilecti]|uniref:Transglutaminase-like enzyme, putative cysteine protease n=1 Tax=Aquimarina amphilecti TaxID=1038014 RepID=A0A1H7MM62_AQUAM|nr:DUF3857 domain-containing protein [Aquimarina amphilecti]SEL12396.1 Transglutaminase-like enzyme, putative cysteine protease [Aquimarina amphilecti]